MTRRALPGVLLSCAVAIALAGCGISDPDAAPPPARTTPVAHQPTSRPPQSATAALGGERGLLVRFARAWFTYTFATLPAQQRELAALATGSLARQLARNGEADLQAQYVRVANLRSDGEVEAIVVRPRAAAIVITRERLTTNGQTQTSWDIYLATVTTTKAGLRVVTWTPASSD
jgi:predicted small lipoprotein YifL